eukprot:TRINITY_DN9195_c0_g1_i1.p1 TRINITY_DN9195_c0_g1~~TRINITY_DN9195_c0_g1_i1.p1  ORF type:complete len:200 (-),score=63.02 TRINITY_DN9195_c0_g1_i1:40-639(-)
MLRNFSSLGKIQQSSSRNATQWNRNANSLKLMPKNNRFYSGNLASAAYDGLGSAITDRNAEQAMGAYKKSNSDTSDKVSNFLGVLGSLKKVHQDLVAKSQRGFMGVDQEQYSQLFNSIESISEQMQKISPYKSTSNVKLDGSQYRDILKRFNLALEQADSLKQSVSGELSKDENALRLVESKLSSMVDGILELKKRGQS